MKALVPSPSRSKVPTHLVRGQWIVLDEDLALVFGVETKRLNEQVRRNETRFEGYAFRLTAAESTALRSQNATSNTGRGGRRYSPWAFTEHGVVMAATVLNSDAAIAAMKLVVEAFVRQRRAQGPAKLPTASPAVGLLPRLQGALEALLDRHTHGCHSASGPVGTPIDALGAEP
ncbi:ORF6N domain-containing protein [Phenylobacterium sp.]|uniref:ORF6N domain-containing protein n=1 Tax=Phenylobacterium sp. TaxID=1871053 RepID=UPI002E34BFB6|nr:ORF6N domain-containing protein [Phenylobacterium sp.]HEX3364203.1 ORF6N domain-containing protein [Phenylobacterium sp.]